MNTRNMGLLAFTFILSTNYTLASENRFAEHAFSFDEAQSQGKLENVLPYLADNISIEIITCDNSIDKFDLDGYKKTYSLIKEHALLLSITREISNLEKCDNGHSCIIHSILSERLVDPGGEYDSTTISMDITKIIEIGGTLKIQYIKASIQCT